MAQYSAEMTLEVTRSDIQKGEFICRPSVKGKTMGLQPDEAIFIRHNWIAMWTCLTLGLVSINASEGVNSTASIIGTDTNSNTSAISANSSSTVVSNTTVPHIKNTTAVVNNTTPPMTSESLSVSNTTLAAMAITTPRSVNWPSYNNTSLSSSLEHSLETSLIQEVTSSKITTDTFETSMGGFVTSEQPFQRSDLGLSSNVIQEATTTLSMTVVPNTVTVMSGSSRSSINASFSVPKLQETVMSLSLEVLQSNSELLLASQTLTPISVDDEISTFQNSSLPSGLVQDSGSSLGITSILRINATTSLTETVSQTHSAWILPLHSSVPEEIYSSATVVSASQGVVSASQEVVSASQDFALSSQEIKASSEDFVSLTPELISSDIELLSTKISEADIPSLHSMQDYTSLTTLRYSSQTILQTSDDVALPVESTSTMTSTPIPSSTAMTSSFVSVESIDVKPLKPVSHIISSTSTFEISSSNIIAEHLVSATLFDIHSSSVHVTSISSPKISDLPSSTNIAPATNATIISTTATTVNRSYHRVTNISFEIQFIGVCDPLVQRKIVLEEFWGYLVVAISTMLQVEKMKIKPKDIACNPIRITFTILDITHPNTTHVLTDFVASGRFTFKLPVLLEDTESKFTYEATSVKIVPQNYDINGGVDTYEMGLSEVDIIVIISACCVSIVLICVGCCICVREYYLRKRSRSFDLSDIVNFNLKLEDYTLTKIPRAKPFYSDGGVKMQSFTRKNGQQTKALLEQDEVSADDTTNENGSLIKELQVRMNQHSDGILIGITKTNMPSANQRSPDLSPCELKDQSKEMLYQHNASPTHCMDNPIYYADDDRFAKV